MGKWRHGHALLNHATSEYRSWSHMMYRCTNPRSHNFKYYGGRGVRVCKRWHVFKNFLADMGPKPWAGYSIDRFPDKDGNYEPGNCRWASCIEQARGRRNVKPITFLGVTQTIGEWADQIGIKRNTVKQRLRAGWLISDALTPRLFHCYEHKKQKGDYGR